MIRKDGFLSEKVSKKQRIAELSGQLAELEGEVTGLRRDAKRGRLVILYANAGEHLVPVYDELVHGADVSLNNAFVDASSFQDETKTYIVGPSTITIRVTR